MRRHLVRASYLATLALAACGAITQSPGSSGIVSHSAASPMEVKSATSVGLTWPISIGPDHSPINHLVGDPSRPGVWFWAWTAQEAYAYFYNPESRTLSSWPIGSSSGIDGLDPYGDSGIAVAPNGDVWLGAYNQLVSLNPTTGAVSRFTIPSPTINALAPADLQPWHDVNSIAVDGSGRVIIGMTAASSLEVFEPASGGFSSIGLPKIGEIQGVAALQDGTVAVAMSNETEPGDPKDAVVLVSPSGSEETIQTDSGWVTSNGTIFASGETTFATIDASGNVSLVSVSSSSAQRIQPNVGALLPDGRMVLATSSGIAIVSSSSTEYLDFPLGSCPLVAVPPNVSPPPSTGGGQCQVAPVAVTVDTAGNIWIAPNLPQYQVGLLPAGSY